MIKFFNVRSGETVEATTEPMIAAYFNSSDQNPNGLVQDFGWRLAPETLKRVRAIQEDEDLVEKIADRYQIPIENVTITDFLRHISNEDDKKARQEASTDGNDYEREYEKQVRDLDKKPSRSNDSDDKSENKTLAKAPKKTSTGKKVSTPAEIAAQKAKDDATLEQMLEDDKKKSDNKGDAKQEN